MKPETKIEKRGGKWVVIFTIGVQTFELAYGGTKAEANWMKKMLDNAFKNISHISTTLPKVIIKRS